MNNCDHQWIGNSGSNDKPCGYCWKYPVLKLRYRCNLCILENCRFCLIKKSQLPLEDSIPVDTRPNRYQTLENIIDELAKKVMKLEETINKIGTVVEKLE